MDFIHVTAIKIEPASFLTKHTLHILLQYRLE